MDETTVDKLLLSFFAHHRGVAYRHPCDESGYDIRTIVVLDSGQKTLSDSIHPSYMGCVCLDTDE